MRTLLTLVVFIFILTACGQADTPQETLAETEDPQPLACSDEELEGYQEAVRDVTRRFDDAVRVADSTARINLSDQVSELQAIRRDAEDVEYPECADEAHRWLVNYMNSTIDAFLAFQSEAPDLELEEAWYVADATYDRYQEALDLVAEDANATLEPVPTATYFPCHPALVGAEFEALFLLDARWYDAMNAEDDSEMRGQLAELRDGDWSECFTDYVQNAEALYSEYIGVRALLDRGELNAAEDRIEKLGELEERHNEYLDGFVDLYVEGDAR